MSSQPRFLQLAEELHRLADFLASNAIQDREKEPSLAPDSSSALWTNSTPSVVTAKSAFKEALSEIDILVNGPLDYIRDWLGAHIDLASLHTMLDFKVIDAIPMKGSISLSALASKTGLNQQKLGRMLRLLACQRFTTEVADDEFSHTVVSATLVQDPELRAQFETQLDEFHKASVETVDYLKKSPNSETSHDSPFKYRHGMPFYEWYEANPQYGARFALSQAGIAKLGRSTDSIHAWIRHRNKKQLNIVDVGGGNGHVAVELANQYSEAQLTVQDISENMFAETEQTTSQDSLSRVAFQRHDFFQLQPIDDKVDAYIIRSCLHNWGDEDGVKILKGFVPAMEAQPEVSLLINESIIPRRGEAPLHLERKLRGVDIAMFVIANSKQRSQDDFNAMLQAADPRFKIERIFPDPGMAVLEVKLLQDSPQVSNGINGDP